MKRAPEKLEKMPTQPTGEIFHEISLAIGRSKPSNHIGKLFK